jgi:hypothetical protein
MKNQKTILNETHRYLEFIDEKLDMTEGMLSYIETIYELFNKGYSDFQNEVLQKQLDHWATKTYVNQLHEVYQYYERN